ncbi:MAG TPA: DHA2 family efflux MFS transporter permease subunit [Acetobacteraceae bacterium]|nr:DHA2 family efflux MFS transporter permease subunit [Acetobacteraceae bacterium]
MPEPLPRSAAGRRNPWLIGVVISIATFMEVLDTTIVNVALRHIAGSLAISYDESTWILTSYLISNAIVLPISGWLATVLGRKRFYMSCVAVFTAASASCALSTSLTWMVISRLVQGAGGGGLGPTEQAMFADTFPIRQRAQAFALYGLTVVSAPAAGPVLGGWITDAASWHWVFLINLPVGLLSLVLVNRLVVEPKALQEDRHKARRGGLRIDYVGFALVALGFGTLQVVLDRFDVDDGFGSSTIVALALVSGIALVTLVVWELVVERPVIDLRLFGRSRGFTIACLLMFLVGFILISTTQLLPQMTQELLDYSAYQAGMTLGLGGVATIVVMPISGLVTGRFIQPKWLIAAALIGSGWAMFRWSGLDLNISFWQVSDARIVQVVFLPFLFIPLSAVAYVGVPPNANNQASAMINLMRNLGGSFGVSFVQTLLSYRTQFHHERLAASITPYNGYSFGHALGAIANAVQTQAQIMSFLDIFWLLGLAAICVFPLALLLPRMPKGAAPTH